MDLLLLNLIPTSGYAPQCVSSTRARAWLEDAHGGTINKSPVRMVMRMRIRRRIIATEKVLRVLRWHGGAGVWMEEHSAQFCL